MYIMASNHSSSIVPHSNSSKAVYRKGLDPPQQLGLVRSLPDVCPKEPTGDSKSLCDEPSVVADQHKWTIYHSKVNLPAALNDPRLAKRESDFFTKTWGQDFVEIDVLPSSYLPPINKEHFSSYMQQTSLREKNHERCKSICPPKDDYNRTAFSHVNKSRADLDQVPKIFMKPDFALDDSLTFNAVLPWSHFSSASGNGSRDAASAKLLQEKLSHYLDIVEVNIAHQISLRSEAFFHAMTSQHELQDYLRKTSQAVMMLRGKISQIDRVMCEGSLRILRQALTRNNCIKVYNKLKLMATVHQTQPTVQLLLSTSEYVGALDLIATTQEVLQQELQGIHSFRHLGSQLCELEKLIDKMIIAEFTSYARVDLNRPLEEDCQVTEEERLVSLVFGLLKQRKLDFFEIYADEMMATAKNIIKQCVVSTVSQIDEIDAELVTKLADQMRMMNFSQWSDLLQSIFAKFTIFLRRVKATINVIRSVVLMVLDKNQRIREMEVMAAQKSLSSERNVDNDLAYLTHEGLFISDAFSEGERPPAPSSTNTPMDASPSSSSSEPSVGESVSDPECTTDSSSSKDHTLPSVSPGGVEIMMTEDLKLTDLELGKIANNIQELLYSASDICHDRCVKFLLARSKDGFLEKLNSSEFVSLSRSVEVFVQDTEKICGRRSMSLRGALQSQANKFVNRFHDERKTKLSLLLDNERWKQADVPAEFQDLVDSITDGKIMLPERKSGCVEERKPSDFLRVDGQKYAVVGTVLILIRIILEYCSCVDDIPSITTDMLTRLSELLKYFNSRSCQLVLGAGALQVVGLKTITTKNLALSSRCLQLIVHYIPVIRAHFEARMQPKQYSMLRQFDHITKDYSDHIAEISAKLVSIMDSIFDKLLSKYEVKAPVPSMCFRNICKHMAKMHEAINDLLPEEQTQNLFLRINTSCRRHLKNQLCHLNVTNDGGPQHGMVAADIAFYTGNVQALKGLKELDLNMSEIWEQKR